MDGVETLAEFDVHEQDQMTKVMRTQVDVVLAEGAAVLNAAIPQVADLAPLSDGGVVLYAQDGTLPVVAEHRAKDNGRAVFVKNGRVVLATGSAEHVLGAVADLTFGRNAIVPDTEALLAAVATAWATSAIPVPSYRTPFRSWRVACRRTTRTATSSGLSAKRAPVAMACRIRDR